MARNQTAAKSAKQAATKRWRGDATRDLATYRFLSLGKALAQHTGKQENIADQIGRHSDLLAHLGEEGYSGLVPQAIIEPTPGDQLYYGRFEQSRNAYLMFCRTANFEVAVGYGMDKIDREIAEGEVEIAIDWAGDLLQQVERGDFRRAAGDPVAAGSDTKTVGPNVTSRPTGLPAVGHSRTTGTATNAAPCSAPAN